MTWRHWKKGTHRAPDGAPATKNQGTQGNRPGAIKYFYSQKYVNSPRYFLGTQTNWQTTRDSHHQTSPSYFYPKYPSRITIKNTTFVWPKREVLSLSSENWVSEKSDNLAIYKEYNWARKQNKWTSRSKKPNKAKQRECQSYHTMNNLKITKLTWQIFGE